MTLQNAIEVKRIVGELNELDYMTTHTPTDEKLEWIAKELTLCIDSGARKLYDDINTDLEEIRNRHFEQMRREIREVYEKLKKRLESEF